MVFSEDGCVAVGPGARISPGKTCPAVHVVEKIASACLERSTYGILSVIEKG